MELEMEYIHTVYEYGSFSKAANALYITQPALSIAVQRVESKLGIPLFDRTCKPIKLTEAGELYIRKYHQILDMEKELEQQLHDLSSLQKGALRIGGTHYFNAYILPPVLTVFSGKYPGIQLELIEAGSGELKEMLYDHKIDLTFNCDLKPRESFHRIPCFTDRVLLAVPQKETVNQLVRESAMTSKDILQGRHRSGDTKAVDLKGFAGIPFIFLKPGNNLFARSTAFFEEAGTKPNIILHVNQLVTAWHLACAGLGATFVSDALIKTETEDVCFYSIPSASSVRHFDMIMSERHYVSQAMKEFCSVFKTFYGEYA